MPPRKAVPRATRWSCPKKCGLAIAAGSKTLLQKAIREHNRTVHAQSRKP